jgi:hypothetical protein
VMVLCDELWEVTVEQSVVLPAYVRFCVALPSDEVVQGSTSVLGLDDF